MDAKDNFPPLSRLKKQHQKTAYRNRRLLRIVTFVHSPFSVWPLNLFVASRAFMKIYEGHFMLCYKENVMLWQILRGHRSAWFPLLSACRFAKFDTSVICHVLQFISVLFWLISIARYGLSLQVIAIVRNSSGSSSILTHGKLQRCQTRRSDMQITAEIMTSQNLPLHDLTAILCL